MQRTVIYLLFALGLALGVTIPKLYKMTQIRGWQPGAIVEQHVITQKWHQSKEEHPRGRDAYWIAWTEDDIRSIGSHRLNVPAETWEAMAPGQPIEIVRFKGDRWPYLRNDPIFASNENFVFDLILLAIEVGTVVWAMRRLRAHFAARAAGSAPAGAA